MAKRKGISVRRRFEIFKRDFFKCQYCGKSPPGVTLEVDHIIAVSEGGLNDDCNLITSCWDCNRGKSDYPLDSIPKSIDDALAERKERAKQLRAYNEFLSDERRRQNEDIDELGRRWHELIKGKDGRRYVFGDSRATSIRTFLQKLPTTEVMEAMEIALSRKSASWTSDYSAWKYFCGICWSKIKEG